MLRKPLLLLLVAACSVGGAACNRQSKDDRAEQERLFRERQRALAIKTYKDLATNFPDTEFAAKAKERIEALETPSKK